VAAIAPKPEAEIQPKAEIFQPTGVACNWRILFSEKIGVSQHKSGILQTSISTVIYELVIVKKS
jgi:hypothetical protein